MAWYDAITKPFRGIGRLVRGNFRGAASDFGDTLKTASVPLAFVNPAAGALARGLGELGDRADEEGGISGIKFGKELLLPAAATFGVGKVGQGIGKLLSKGAGAATQSAAQSATPVVPVEPSAGMGLIPAPEPISAAVAQAPGRFAGVGRLLSNAGRFAAKNPELVRTGLEAYGAYRNDAFEQEMLQDELDRRRRAAEARAQAFARFNPSFGGY